MPRVRPEGICTPERPDQRCWACNYTGGLGKNASSQMRIWTAMNSYEALVEAAEEAEVFSAASIWRANGKGYTEHALATKVIHDLWFHRLIEPEAISTNGIVRWWRWA